MSAVHKIEEAAFHEAGHTLAFSEGFGFQPESTRIGENGSETRVVKETRISNARIVEVAKRERLFRYIMGCLAGKCAAERIHGHKADGNWWRTSGDYKEAYESALELNSGDSLGAELLLKWLQRKTELLLEQQWPRVHKLAFALLEHGELTGDQMNKVLSHD